MIKKCNDDILQAKGIGKKYFLFYQVWKELTHSKTLDSYQYRIMNTVSALQELELVIMQRLNRFCNTNHNIEECKAETLNIIKNDTVLKTHYPAIWNRLVAHLSEKAETDAQQKALRYQIEYCYKIIKDKYFVELVKDLEKSIEDADSKNIIEKTNQVVSNCTSRGWSAIALHGMVNMLHNSVTNTNAWNDFKDRILSTRTDEYHILIPLKVRVNNSFNMTGGIVGEVKDLGLEVKESTEIICTYPYVTAAEKHQKYMVIPVEAHDYYSASHMAIAKCSNILNLLSFYGVIEAWNLRDITWYAVNAGTQTFTPLKAKDLYSTYDNMDGATRVFRYSKMIDKEDGNTLQARLRATYSYANMGKASYAQAEKYINTWVALESLCRTDVYDNIISNVLETVPPALCLRYIYRLIRNFVEDCLRCNLEFKFTTMSIDLHTTKEELVKVIIKIFNCKVLYEELKEKCRVNSLLLERCEEMHDIVSSEEEMFSRIERHYSNVKRQISRLYRLRNEIAHTAMNDKITLIRYIEHLDDYLAGLVYELIMCSVNKNEDRIELLLEILRENYREFQNIKNSKKKVNLQFLKDEILNTGIINLL